MNDNSSKRVDRDDSSHVLPETTASLLQAAASAEDIRKRLVSGRNISSHLADSISQMTAPIRAMQADASVFARMIREAQGSMEHVTAIGGLAAQLRGMQTVPSISETVAAAIRSSPYTSIANQFSASMRQMAKDATLRQNHFKEIASSPFKEYLAKTRLESQSYVATISSAMKAAAQVHSPAALSSAAFESIEEGLANAIRDIDVGGHYETVSPIDIVERGLVEAARRKPHVFSTDLLVQLMMNVMVLLVGLYITAGDQRELQAYLEGQLKLSQSYAADVKRYKPVGHCKVVDSVNLKRFPRARSGTVATVQAGDTVMVVKAASKWVLVRTGDDIEGWIMISDLQQL